jgi:hypothetical protein
MEGRNKMKPFILIIITGLALLPAGCARVTLEGGDKPIRIQHDVTLRVDEQLEEFFAYERQMRAERRAAATQPAAPSSTVPDATDAPLP